MHPYTRAVNKHGVRIYVPYLRAVRIGLYTAFMAKVVSRTSFRTAAVWPIQKFWHDTPTRVVNQLVKRRNGEKRSNDLRPSSRRGVI